MAQERDDAVDAATSDCPLPHAVQTRNLLIFASNWALLYLASPVTYVGVVQASLLNRLGFNNEDANLPASVYLWTTPLALFVAWAFPQVRRLKRLFVGAYLLTALMGALVASAVVLLGPQEIFWAVVAHAAIWGCCSGVSFTCQWELIGRGVSESRRGTALAISFGFGPVLAVAASFGFQMALSGQVQGFHWLFAVEPLPYPWNFAILFAASVPVLVGAALQSSFCVVPLPAVEETRQPFVQGIFGGAGHYFGNPWILVAALAYVLVYAGHMILNNISLYTEVLLRHPAEEYAGTLQMLRFGFKIGAGFLLGWLLIGTNAKTLLLVTASLTFASTAWAMWVEGMAYLLCFGVLGAGELFGAYYPNYIVSCSAPSRMRRNMAFTTLITMAVGFAPVLFGRIADRFGTPDRAFGFKVSFAVSMGIVLLAMALVAVFLPARPRPPDNDA